MSYPRQMGLGELVRKSGAHDTAEVVSAAAAVYGGYLVTKAVELKRFSFYVSVAIVAATTAPVVKISRRPTFNSSSGELEIARLTLPTGTAIGKVVYKDVDPYQLLPGDELSIEHVTQAADPGTAAGAGYYDAILQSGPESDANCSALLASA